jgi:SAM-dependent methyltransferase
LPTHASVLDVGCGDGELAAEIGRRRTDVTVRGIDVLVRNETAIPVDSFNGEQIPFEDDAFDVVLLIDVLHHTGSPQRLLQESVRVAGKYLIIKDHYLQGVAARQTLRFMDQVGNSRHGVDIPCNYLTPDQWSELFQQSELGVIQCVDYLGLYPPPLSWFFERSLHFLAVLKPQSQKHPSKNFQTSQR